MNKYAPNPTGPLLVAVEFMASMLLLVIVDGVINIAIAGVGVDTFICICKLFIGCA